MACKIENIKYKGQQIESSLGSKLLDIFGSVEAAKEQYDKLTGTDFINKFGDWINDTIERRTNEQGEPLIIENVRPDESVHYYFESKNGEKLHLLTREFNSFTSPDLTNEIKEITEQLASFIYKNNFNSDFEQISGTKLNIENEIKNFVSINKKPAQDAYDATQDSDIKDLLDYYDNILKHSTEFKTEIIKFFAARKLVIKNAELEDATQEALNEGLQGGDIQQSFEKNSKDNATANVKLMLSFLPKVNNVTGEPVVGDYLGQPLFRSFDAIHSELQTNLSDITTMYVQGQVTDVYTAMYNKIKELSEYKQSYKSLIGILDAIDEQKKTEFVQAFYLSKINFYTTTMDGTNFTVKNISNVNNPIDSRLKEYYINYQNRFIKSGKVDLKSIVNLNDKVTKLLSNTRDKKNNPKYKSEDDFYNLFEEDVATFINILEEFGVTTITPDAMDIFLKQFKFNEPANNAYNIMYQQYQGKLINLKNLLSDIESGSLNTITNNPFTNRSNLIFNGIAEAEDYFNETSGESTVFSNDKTFWTQTRPSYISNRINSIKNNSKILKNLLNSNYGKSSLWSKHLLGEERNTTGDYVQTLKARESSSEKRLKLLQLSTFNSFQEQNKSSEGNDNKTISKVDQLADKLNKVVRGTLKDKFSIYSTITPGDKATLHEIRIDHFLANTISSTQGDTMVFSEQVVNSFVDYFSTEVDRMKQAYQELATLPKEKLIVNYHTDSKGNIYSEVTEENPTPKLLGNAFKSLHILSELSFENISQSDNEALRLYNEDGSPVSPKTPLTNNQKALIKQTINKILNNRVKDNVEYFKKIGLLVDSVTEEGNRGFIMHGLDSRIMEYYTPDVQLNKFEVNNIISDFTINSIVASIEYTKLFTGDPSMYKGMVDFFKRVPATYSDGTNLRLGLTEGDAYFDIAVIENQIVKSKFLDEIEKSLDTTDLSKSEKDYILDSYTKINQTDAQAWITPKRWAFLISRTGKWNDKYASVYNKMTTGEALTADEMKTAAQPLKGVYFGLVNNVPTYLKYSQAVLSPQLVKGSQLENLYDTMVANNISESITLDGIKVGATTPNKITDENGNLQSNLNLSTITLNNADWKLQQDLPTKTIKPTLLGSQIQKNIYSSLTDEGTYELKGETFNGSEMFQAINDNLSAMSNMSMAGLSSELGKDATGRINKDHFYTTLEKSLTERGIANNLLKAVQKNMPIEAIPGIKDKLYNTMFSMVNKAAVKLKTNGGSFIQMSNFGLDKVTADKKGVTWLVEPSELKPPTIETDADGKKFITPGQIFISHTQIAKLIPNYKELAEQGKLNDIIDSKLLRAIGYRIPNQGQSSNDPLQIVGILPESMGDTIVGYTEIPTKTGSDFDIDKMYVLLPNLTASYTEKSFKLARKYISENQITLEEMYDELINNGFTHDELSEGNATKNIQDNFIKEHLFNSNSELEYHDDFMSTYQIDEISKVEFLDYDVDLYKNNSNQLQNRLFDLYWAVLTNEKTYGDLITPIDFPHIKDKIKEIHGDNSKQTGENLKFHDPLYQLDLKFTYAGGKSGVGITANMLVDHNRSRFVTMKFNNYSLGVGHEIGGETVFDYEYSEELNGTKYKIKDTISAFLNAFVDNAKDPYVNDGNFNTYTSSVAFMLIRAGVHPDWIISFLGQPVLKELADFTQIYESKVIPKENTGKSSFDIIYEKYANQQYNKKGITDKSVLNYGFVNDYGNQSDVNIKILETFKEYQEQAKRLNESVQLSRFDTNGTGKNVLDLLMFKNRIKETFVNQNKDGFINGHFEKYFKNGKKTSLGTQVENTLLYVDDILNNNPSLFLLGSKPIQDLLNNISIDLVDSRGGSRGYLKSEDLGKLYFKEIYKYIMSDFAPFKVEKPLDYIKQTISEISAYKIEDKQYETGNFFMENIRLFNNSFGIDNKNKSIEFQDRLGRSAYDLYVENPELATKVFVSSYLMNGFENKVIDIKEYIPYQWFIENDIQSFIQEKDIQLKEDINRLAYFKEQFIKNNIDNNVLSPKISDGNVGKIRNTNTIYMFQIAPSKQTSRYILGTAKQGETVFPRYLKKNSSLFELKGYMGDNAYYIKSNSLGFEDKQSYLNLKEYKFDSPSDSNFEDANTKKLVKDANSWFKENIESDPNFVPWSERMLYDQNIIDMEKESLQNILFSQNNVVSLFNLKNKSNKQKFISDIINEFFPGFLNENNMRFIEINLEIEKQLFTNGLSIEELIEIGKESEKFATEANGLKMTGYTFNNKEDKLYAISSMLNNIIIGRSLNSDNNDFTQDKCN